MKKYICHNCKSTNTQKVGKIKNLVWCIDCQKWVSYDIEQPNFAKRIYCILKRLTGKSIKNKERQLLYTLYACVVHFFKLRYTAQKFDIWKEKIDQNRKRDLFMGGDWIGYDGVLYYGHPLGIFFKSLQNSWWLDERSNFEHRIN